MVSAHTCEPTFARSKVLHVGVKVTQGLYHPQIHYFYQVILDGVIIAGIRGNFTGLLLWF